MDEDEISYHSGRALAELDQARRCADAQAARSHLELAERHLDRMRILARASAANDPAPPRLA
ncbi:MAG TPA: hypothetical protein VF548_02330 [Allosphingosinicella sp.]|jgi:hypothetical protein